MFASQFARDDALVAPFRGILPHVVGRAAVFALHDELALSPKPGLVTLMDSGSHTDMDADTFMRSLFALRGYFARMATLGANGAAFDALECCGLAAETRMYAATNGVNTHRGAIFMLGLLCAAAGAVTHTGALLQPSSLRHTLIDRWGDSLRKRVRRVSQLPGGQAARRHGLRSASEEAAAGFPVLFETALPALTACASRGMPKQNMLLDTFFHVLAVLDDSNLAHRGGMEGLRFAQAAARRYLEAGGSMRPDGVADAHRISVEFVRRRLSPGGVADTLAAACWMLRLGLVTPRAP